MELTRDDIRDVIREEAERLVREVRPLMKVQDVAKSLNVSSRTVETLIADGELRPLWIKGQRRFHPDAIERYLERVAT